MKDNNVRTLVNKTVNKNITECKWLFQIKIDVNGQRKYKDRLVAKGFTHQFGKDYNETFRHSIIRHSSLRLLMGGNQIKKIN